MENAYLADTSKMMAVQHPEARFVEKISFPGAFPFSPRVQLVYVMPMALTGHLEELLGNARMFALYQVDYSHVMKISTVAADCKARTNEFAGKVMVHEPPTGLAQAAAIPGWIPALCDSNWSKELAALKARNGH